MSDTKIKVSIVIITHNQDELFKRALKSVLMQDFFKDYEIIVINDSSTDDTNKYMQEMLTQYAFIKYRIVNNHSAILSRKDGLDLAKGEYVAFLDGDDYYHEHFITEMYSKAMKYDADIVNCNVFYIKPNHKIRPSSLGIDKLYPNSLSALKALFNDYYVRGFTPTKLYKTSLLKQIDFNLLKDLPVYEDIVMNYLVFKSANKLVSIKKPLYYYDKSNTSSITSKCDKRVECNLKSAGIIRKDIQSLNNKKLLKAFKNSYFRRYLLLLYDLKVTRYPSHHDKAVSKRNAIKNLKKIYKAKSYK